ncbi:hypothetical protein PanWU01x14_088050 [Parasponia andersonii]|uniref:Uncharacterized protein n=1 Tax=Parasponia andersonii TaxID=3476 RepID=A0A2P5D7V0_PARAD|nr:hypothetical protein PanWU01x14_088050 [Parasponia andersonii]
MSLKKIPSGNLERESSLKKRTVKLQRLGQGFKLPKQADVWSWIMDCGSGVERCRVGVMEVDSTSGDYLIEMEKKKEILGLGTLLLAVLSVECENTVKGRGS